MIYKERLKYLKDKNKVNQEAIASYLGITRGRYSHYETEYEIMPIKHLNNICNFFNISFDYLFSFSNQENYNNIVNNINLNKSGLRLREFRKENKLTQEKLAKILNISRTTITEYERGTNLIATPFLYTICREYKISADYLLGKVDEPKYLK